MQVSPACRWRSQRVCFLPGEIPCGCRARWFWLFSLREHQSRLSAHTHRFLFREWSRLSRPPVFFLPGTCEEKTAGQRFSAPGWKRAHAGSDPACLAFATQRDVSRPFYPTWPASLCKRERSGLVQGKWRWAGRWQHVTGSFRCWGAVGQVPSPVPSGLPAPSAAKAGMDAELFRVLSKVVEELDLEWSPPEEPSRSRLDEWFLPGRRQAPQQRPSPFFPEVHDELTRSWRSPYSARLRTSASSALTTVDGTEEKGYERMPQLDESVAAHLCPPTAIGWKAKASHPSKPCRTTSALAGRSYASAGQAASALHSMAVLQVYQAKLLSAVDESEPDPATLRELRSATDLALRATKTTAQAIGRSMASLVVLERHLWLTLTEIKDADRVSFLDAPISPSGLFGPAVKGFAERFTEAQKVSQAMRHFLPKRSSPAAAQSHPRTAPTQQPAKPAPAVYDTQQPRGRSRSARRHPPPKRQGPRLKIALDPAPPASSWSAGQEEERVESRHGRTAHQKSSHEKPLGTPFFRQKRTVSQPTNIVPHGLSSHESGDSARTRSGHSETRGHLQERHRSPTQSVSENAGPYGRSIASVTAGPAPHAPPSTLVETTGSTQRMASRTLAYQGESGLCNSPDPLEEPTVDGEGRGHGVGPHQESCHDRRLQHRLGGTVRRQTDLRPLVGDGERLPHQLLGNASSLSSLPVFPAGPNRTPCADSLRQYVRGVLYKLPGRCLLEAPLYSGRAPSGMGSAQPALAEGSTPAGQTEPRSGYVISEQCPLRGVDAPSAGGSEDLEDLFRSRTFRLQRQHSLPNLLFEGQGRVGPRLAQPPPLCIPPDRPASTGRQAYQGTGSQGAIGGPLVEEPTLVVRADSATDSSPLARAPETGSPLSGERNNMAPSTRAVGSLHLAAQWEPTGLPERVLNTISEARAPSTRRLYALKWSVFSTWCLNRGENPSTSELAVVLSFLQELLDKGCSHSTLKVFVAAIAAFHAPIAGQSVGRDNSVVRFLKGARRLNPPRPLTVPTWDLPTVLRALKGPPFEPLQSTDLRSLSLKTALLLALASVKRVGDLQALSTSPACLEFGPNDSKVVLKPRHAYVPKVLSTPFRAQVITLSALPPSEEDRELSLLCPVRTLSIPPLLGIRNSSLLASVTTPKDIRSRSRDSLSR